MKALITGVTGQTGSYLAEFLLEKNYEVFGLIRRNSTQNYKNIEHIIDKITLVSGDLSDQTSLDSAIRQIQPDEIYNLAAQSFVPLSWSQPIMTSDITGMGVLRMLEATKKYAPNAKFYQASSSEMFGKVVETPQNEKTPFYPRSPYGIAKTFGHYMTVNYRESYGIYACSGICFNHESPRRGLEFVTRKITHTAYNIKKGVAKELLLGNLQAKRDWGYAKDYVEAMWTILQQKSADDYIVATGENHTVQEFVDETFKRLDLDYKDYVKVDPKFYRPAEVDVLLGSIEKIKKLGWTPRTDFKTLVHLMVDNEA